MNFENFSIAAKIIFIATKFTRAIIIALQRKYTNIQISLPVFTISLKIAIDGLYKRKCIIILLTG